MSLKKAITFAPGLDSVLVNELYSAGIELVNLKDRNLSLEDDLSIWLTQVERYLHNGNKDLLVLPLWEGSVIRLAEVCTHFGLTGNSLAAAVNSRDKQLMAQCFDKADIPHPKSYSHEQSQELSNADFPLVVKLAAASNSYSVSKVTHATELRAAVQRLETLATSRMDTVASQAQGQRILIQEYIDGREYNLDIVFNNEQFQLLGLFEKGLMRPPYFAEEYSISPAGLTEQASTELFTVAVASIKALGATVGVAHVEIKISSNGQPVVIETALRPGGFYTPRAIYELTGKSSWSWLVHALNGVVPNITFASDSVAYGAVNAYQKGVLAHISGVDTVQANEHVLEFEVLTKADDRIIPLPEGTDYHLAKYLLKTPSRDQSLLLIDHIKSTIVSEII